MFIWQRILFFSLSFSSSFIHLSCFLFCLILSHFTSSFQYFFALFSFFLLPSCSFSSLLSYAHQIFVYLLPPFFSITVPIVSFTRYTRYVAAQVLELFSYTSVLVSGKYLWAFIKHGLWGYAVFIYPSISISYIITIIDLFNHLKRCSFVWVILYFEFQKILELQRTCPSRAPGHNAAEAAPRPPCHQPGPVPRKRSARKEWHHETVRRGCQSPSLRRC